MQPKFYSSENKLPKSAVKVDAYELCLKELFFIRNPQVDKRSFDDKQENQLNDFLKNGGIDSVWVYYEALNKAVRIVEEDAYFEIRTARNKNLITKEEQVSYRNMCVGIAGLSVGSAVVEALVRSGGPKYLKISDFDTVEVSNLNRLKASLTDLGLKKIDVASERIFGVDPFTVLTRKDEGLNKGNLEDFIAGGKKLNVFVDAMDSFELKISARLLCKKYKVALVMATDVGDSVVMDIERYDLDASTKVFNGAIDDEVLNIAKMSPKQWLGLAVKVVGEDIPIRVKQSVLEIGKTISGLPQLGTTAMLAGAATSFVLREIACERSLPSGKYRFDLKSCFDSERGARDNAGSEKEINDQFYSLFGQ